MKSRRIFNQCAVDRRFSASSQDLSDKVGFTCFDTHEMVPRAFGVFSNMQERL
jgi:hypothetical protein